MHAEEKTAQERLLFLELETMHHREAEHGVSDYMDFTPFPNCPRCNELEGKIENLIRFIESPTGGVQ